MRKLWIVFALVVIMAGMGTTCDLVRPWSLDDWIDLVTSPGDLMDAIQEAEGIIEALPDALVPDDLQVGK